MRAALHTAVFLLIPAPLVAGEHPGKYEKWLNQEAVYIISAQERKQFANLATDEEREAFITKFWRIRDTDSSTQENEFMTEHHARIQYANDRFSEGIPGWKTDRGRIWIMHGPPDDIRYEYGGGSLGIDIETPTEVLAGEANPDRRRSYRITFNKPEAEVWVYRRLEGAQHFPGYFEVIFSRTDPVHIYELHQNLRHLSSRSAMDYGQRVQRDYAVMTFLRGHFFGGPFRIVYAGEYKFQDLDDFYQSIFHPQRLPAVSVTDFQMGVQDLERPTGEALMDKLALGRSLKEKVRSRVFFEDVPLTIRVGTLQSETGSTLLPVSLGIAQPDASTSAGDTLDLLLELTDANGETVSSLADSVEVKPQEDQSAGRKKFLYQARLGARPGRYRLQVFAAFRGRRAAALQDTEVELPDYATEGLAMSDLLLFEKVLSRDSYKNGSGRSPGVPQFLGRTSPVFLKNLVLIPSSDSRFRRGQKLTTFFEVYNVGLTPGETVPRLSVRCRFERADGWRQELPERLLDYVSDSDSRRTTYGISVPLLSFAAGEYQVEFEVHDRVLGKTVARSATFSVY